MNKVCHEVVFEKRGDGQFKASLQEYEVFEGFQCDEEVWGYIVKSGKQLWLDTIKSKEEVVQEDKEYYEEMLSELRQEQEYIACKIKETLGKLEAIDKLEKEITNE